MEPARWLTRRGYKISKFDSGKKVYAFSTTVVDFLAGLDAGPALAKEDWTKRLKLKVAFSRDDQRFY